MTSPVFAHLVGASGVRAPPLAGVAWPEQIHGATVRGVREPGWVSGTDGLWTRSLPLGVRTADCVPLLIWSVRPPLFGLVHAGRAGIGQGIIERAVEALVAAGAEPARMEAWAGPHIGPCCYVFPPGSPLARALKAQLPHGTRERASGLAVDLAAEASARLRTCGVLGLGSDGRCTCCHPWLPSHRRQGKSRAWSLFTVVLPLFKERSMSIDPELLSILACPETKEPVHLAPQDLVDALNRRIAQGEVRNRGGEVVTEPIDGGLVREDGRYLYPIREDIPIMLIEEAIELPPLGL